MGYQWRDINLPLGQHVKQRLEVASLSPADKADGIVLAPFFIQWVVSSRSIGAGNLKGEFFFVEIGPRQFQPDHPDQDNPPPLAAHEGRLVHRLVTLGRCGNDDRINPAAAGNLPGSGQRVLTPGEVNRLRSE